MDEAAFVDSIACRFPYEDLDASIRLADQACGISVNAAIALVDELARPPHDVAAPVENRIIALDRVAAQISHPLATTMLEFARRVINGKCPSVAESIAILKIIENFPGQYAALSLAYMTCDDVNGDADAEYERIRRQWDAA